MTAPPRTTGPAREAVRWPLAAALLLAVSLGPAASAQDMGPPAPPPEPAADDSGAQSTGQGVVGSVNGVPITNHDVLTMIRALLPGQPVDEKAFHFVRRQIAEQILLATEAERLGVTLGEQEIIEYWKDTRGVELDLEEAATQSKASKERLLELARRQALAELYLYHRVGLRYDWGHRIKPDPTLQRWVTVTPKDQREYFLEHRADFDEPPLVHYAVYPCPGEEAAQAVAEALAEGVLPVGRRPVRETTPVEELDEWFGFAPQIAAFLHTAAPLAVSEPAVLEDGVLVVQLLERTEGHVAEFAEVQQDLRRQLMGNKIHRARTALIDELSREAAIWPLEIFAEEPTRNP